MRTRGSDTSSTHIICYWQECLTIQDTLPAWNWWTPGQTWRTGRCRVSGTWSSWPFWQPANTNLLHDLCQAKHEASFQ